MKTPANERVETNRRPALPFDAGWEFDSVPRVLQRCCGRRSLTLFVSPNKQVYLWPLKTW